MIIPNDTFPKNCGNCRFWVQTNRTLRRGTCFGNPPSTSKKGTNYRPEPFSNETCRLHEDL